MTEKEFYDAMISFSDPHHIPMTSAGSLAKQTAQSCTTVKTKIRAVAPARLLVEQLVPLKLPRILNTREMANIEATREHHKQGKEFFYLALALICIPFLVVTGAAQMLGVADDLQALIQSYSAKSWYVSVPLHAALWAMGLGITVAALVAITAIKDKLKDHFKR